MAKITQEKTHALLEKLAEYVMSELPTREEIQNELNQKADKTEVNEIKTEVIGIKIEVNEIKKDVKDLSQKMNIIINGQDNQAKQLSDIRTEQAATNSALLRHEERITALEQK